jgi:PAS domain S-box-containing protein
MTPDPDLASLETRHGAARDGVCVVGPEWRIGYANASWWEILRLFGRGEPSAGFWDALPGWRESAAGKVLVGAMERGESAGFTLPRARGGGRVWEVTADPAPGAGLVIRLHNASAALAAGEAERRALHDLAPLAEREARLDTMVARAPAAIALLEADTLVVREANHACSALLAVYGVASRSLAGRTPAEVIPGWAGSEAERRVRRVAETGEPWEAGEYPVTDPDEGYAWLRVSVRAVDDRDGRRFLLALVEDVTGAVFTRRAVEAERKGLFHVLDTLPVGVVVATAPDGRISYVNPAAVALARRDPESGEPVPAYPEFPALNKPSGVPFREDELPIVLAFAGEATRDVEVVLELDDGTERTVLASGVPLRNGSGEVERAVVVFYDISDRLRMERELLVRGTEAEAAAADAALRAEESRALREIGRALVSELEPERVLEMAARAAMELLGARGSAVTLPRPDGTGRVGPACGSLAGLKGRTAPEPAAHQEHSVILQSTDPLAHDSPLGGLLVNARVRNALVSPLRAFGVALGTLAVVDRDPEFTGEDARVLEALADSAALAMHNARLHEGERRRGDESRALLAAAEALSSTLDPAEVMERIVGIARELTGADGAGLTVLEDDPHSGAERVRMGVATGCLEPLRGVDSPLAGSLTERVMRAGAPHVASGEALTNAAGGIYLARMGVEHMAVAPLRVGDEPMGIIAVVNTVHGEPFSAEHLRLLALLAEQASVAVRNARLYEAAQAASRAKSGFLAAMSHELRTPLNALEGYASLMADGIYGDVNAGQAQALARMRSAQRHLLGLIEQVLDVTRLEAGVKRPAVKPVDLAVLTASVVDALCGAGEQKGVALELDPCGPAPARTDPGMVRQILTNLVGNALKFTDTGEVRVTVISRVDGVEIAVTDSGMGIAPEQHERIWEAFYQVDPALTRREGGTGLGLSLSRDYARLLGGDITVRSAPGLGSTFILTLPLDAPD